QEGQNSLGDPPGGFRGGRCLHCNQVREALNGQLRRSGRWDRDMAWRYPLPENVGIELDVDRGNVVKKVTEKTPASAAGLKAGDVVRRLNGVPIHSFSDAQYALDRAPKAGPVEVVWRHGDEEMKEKLTLPEGWKKSDISWRPSMRFLVPTARLYGEDLTGEEKKKFGLPEKQLAFRQRNSVPEQAKAAGIHGGDVILGFDGKQLEMDMTAFLFWVQRNYLIG